MCPEDTGISLCKKHEETVLYCCRSKILRKMLNIPWNEEGETYTNWSSKRDYSGDSSPNEVLQRVAIALDRAPESVAVRKNVLRNAAFACTQVSLVNNKMRI